MRAHNVLCNSYCVTVITRPLLCARITCYVTVITVEISIIRCFYHKAETVTFFSSSRFVIEESSLSSVLSYFWSCLWPVFKLYEFVILLFTSELFHVFRLSGGLKIKILQHVFVNTLWPTWDVGPFVNEQTGNMPFISSSQVYSAHFLIDKFRRSQDNK
jgi:hypothetical protein